jgi:hypothetical protein
MIKKIFLEPKANGGIEFENWLSHFLNERLLWIPESGETTLTAVSNQI